MLHLEMPSCKYFAHLKSFHQRSFIIEIRSNDFSSLSSESLSGLAFRVACDRPDCPITALQEHASNRPSLCSSGTSDCDRLRHIVNFA